MADFFIKAGYDAIVPGKHDFFYGAERLRQLARYMASRSDPVLLLAANLVIRSNEPGAGPRKAEHHRKREYWLVDTPKSSTDGGTPKAAMRWSLPGSVLPWNRTFKLSNGNVAIFWTR